MSDKNITFSQDQESALKLMSAWWDKAKDADFKKDRNVDQTFYLSGYAGTGKTTIIKYFRDIVSKSAVIKHAAFTGKAALQMRKGGAYNAQTIHSLIYSLDDDSGSDPTWKLNPNSDLYKSDLLICDEVSMVSEKMGRDLLSFRIPILVLGDLGQLPPIKGAGFFTEREPDAMLTQVHRQALENPILRLATDVRMGKPLSKFASDQLNVYPTDRGDLEQYDQIICGKNDTRNHINRFIRTSRGIHKDRKIPVVREKLICTRNNNKQGLFNGLMGLVTKDALDENDRVILDFTSDEGRAYEGLQIHTDCFTNPEALKELSFRDRYEFNEFDYGYAITCHKSQGSQWDNVLLCDDSFLVWDKAARRQWLYTAVTRAAEKLTIVKYKGGK